MPIRFDRLNMLADLLDQLPPEKFNFKYWAEGKGIKEGKTPHECGTPACALGWATTFPDFEIELQVEYLGTHHARAFVCPKGYEGYPDNYAAVAASEHAFGLTNSQHNWLFVPSRDFADEWSDEADCYVPTTERGQDLKPTSIASAKTVAAHIRQFIAEAA